MHQPKGESVDVVEVARMKPVASADTPHDEATAPFIMPSAGVPSAELGSTAISKLNWRVAPFCGLMTILAYMDRGNLGFAASKICDKLSLSHSEYGVGASLFFVGYVLSQIPSNLLLKKVGATRWLSFLLIFWGIAASSLAFIQNVPQFYVLRFLLGVAEGGYFPGVWYYFTTFYPDTWLIFPFSISETGIQLATPLSAPLAAGLLALNGIFGIDGWRVLFFLEGIVPIIYGAFIPWILPSSPEQASFLTQEEKSWLTSKLKHNPPSITIDFISELKMVFSKVVFWRIAMFLLLRFVLVNTGLYWTTLIIDDMLNGKDDDDDDTCASSKSTAVLAILLTTVPFSISAASCLYVGHISPRLKRRILTTSAVFACASISWIVWLITRHQVFTIALLALSVAITCPNAIQPVALGVFSCHYDQEIRAIALACLNTIASFGGIIGPLTVGALVDSVGYGAAVIFLVVVTLTGSAVILTVHDPQTNTYRDLQESLES